MQCVDAANTNLGWLGQETRLAPAKLSMQACSLTAAAHCGSSHHFMHVPYFRTALLGKHGWV